LTRGGFPRVFVWPYVTTSAKSRNLTPRPETLETLPRPALRGGVSGAAAVFDATLLSCSEIDKPESTPEAVDFGVRLP
jgi:hypothetical protein